MTEFELPNPGDMFLGQWKIDGEVGHGGFSVVYQATDSQGRLAAIKVLLPEDDEKAAAKLSYDGELADRFLREARVLEKLENPYIMRLWDYGESPTGLLYMVFEFIDGRTLFQDIKDNGPMRGDRVVHVLRQTLIGLETAHQHGILHRDIKPNNIMLFSRDGDRDRVKLVDFGIAKMYGEATAMPGNDLTAAGLLVGTPRYMPPEQLKGEDLSPPSDIYSLGLCAIEMLSGRKCISHKDRLKIIEAQLMPEPVPIPDNVDATEGLKQIIRRMIMKKIDQRYQNATDALRDLEALAGDPGATGDTVFERVPASLEIPSSSGVVAGDEETVLHRVNAAALDQLIASTPSPNAAPNDPTMLANGAPNDIAQTQPLQRQQPHRSPDQSYGSGEMQRPPVDQSYGSGEMQRPPVDQSYGSGEMQRPPVDQSYGSGERPRPPVDQSYGSGEIQRPPVDQSWGSGEMPRPPVDQSYGSGEMQRPPVDQSWGSGEIQRPPQNFGDVTKSDKLNDTEKIAVGLSALLPGVGHLMLGQTAKGIGALAIFLLTAGLAWILLAPASAIDAFLVIRASKKRQVGPYEFFPDYKDFL